MRLRFRRRASGVYETRCGGVPLTVLCRRSAELYSTLSGLFIAKPRVAVFASLHLSSLMYLHVFTLIIRALGLQYYKGVFTWHVTYVDGAIKCPSLFVDRPMFKENRQLHGLQR